MPLSSRHLTSFLVASLGLHLFVLIIWRAPTVLPPIEPPRVLLFDVQALAPVAAAPTEPAPPPPLPEPPPKPEPPKPEPPKPRPLPEVKPEPPPKPVVRERPKPVPKPEPKPEPVKEVVETPPPPPLPNIAPKADPVVKARYEQQLYGWLSRHKNYPLVARRRGLQGSTMVRITIDRSGRVLASALEAKSGYSILNDEALAMVKRADPFPPMPETYAGETFEFLAPVEFSLR